MFKRLAILALTIFITLFVATAYAATPKYSADKAVLAYAEMYTFGTSENIAATGIPQEFADEIEKRLKGHLMLPFKNYPLDTKNFAKVQDKLVEKLHEIIKISARLKVDDAETPIVEITVNHIDQKAVDKVKANDANFVTLDVMRHISEPVELATDGQFQEKAVACMLGLIDELSATTEPQTIDVPCKLIEDGGEAYWMPQDVTALSKFVDPVFVVKETDPKAIDELLIQIFGGMPKGEQAAEESAAE